MPVKFLPLGGGSGFFQKGGVEVPILFLWAWGFFRKCLSERMWWISGGKSSFYFPKKRRLKICHLKLHHILHS